MLVYILFFSFNAEFFFKSSSLVFGTLQKNCGEFTVKGTIKAYGFPL